MTGLGHVSAMFDDFFTRGGNCVDSSHIYGGGGKNRPISNHRGRLTLSPTGCQGQ
jgi:hypothetical protein